MLHSDDIYDMICEIVRTETVFLRHYLGEVCDNNDPSKLGRVKVMLYDLGMDNMSLGMWCYPRQGHSMSVPKIGAWVEVYFLNGDSGKPVYLHLATEVNRNIPSKWTGNSIEHVLFEDPLDSANHVLYDAQGNIVIGSSKAGIRMLEATESYVLGDTFKTELEKQKKMITDLQTAFSTWAPVPNDGGAALKAAAATFIADPVPNYANILSTLIKGS